MKLSEQWIREWVSPKLSREALIEKLTMAGIAVESCEKQEDGDTVFEFELTPNRGDCLSVLGIAREIRALTGIKINLPDAQRIKNNIKNNIKIDIQEPKSCPRYTGRVIKNITPGKTIPKEIQQKLIKSGLKLIHPVVDVLNYVMLEIGQPLHAFDLAKINEKIIVRNAKQGEKIILLDGKEIVLDKNILVIADKEKPLAMAGIMGGLDSGVTENTQSIFIESAFFAPDAIAGDARRYGLHTDASHRFERGVDPELPLKALERATELLNKIYSNLEVAEIIEKTEKLPKSPKIKLRPERVNKILGYDISEKEIKKILESLKMIIEKNTIIPPSYRFDITEEIDLIEEIARINGYDKLKSHASLLPLRTKLNSEKIITVSEIKTKLVNMGYQEAISYSFISEELQQKINPSVKSLALVNPLSAELAVMRTSLWGSLLEIVQHNLNRQQDYLRFFEVHSPLISGIWAGLAYPEQWGEKKREVDFFDLKNNLECLNKNFVYKAAQHLALHPGQTAEIFLHNQSVGFCGALHPELQKQFDLELPVFLFELKLEALIHKKLPEFEPITKFPAIRRDIALVIESKTTVGDLQNYIKKTAGNLLADLRVFDVYKKQSIALGLIFQAKDRTLIEDEVNSLMDKITTGLKQTFNATLRE